jgi:tRNA (guanine37-N1)-methyltransferase
MRVSIVTLFPELFVPFTSLGMIGRAVASSILAIDLVDLRPFGLGRHKNVDDTPYGGGSGMVLRVEPIVAALETIDPRSEDTPPRAHRVLLTPQGTPFTQQVAARLATHAHLALVCGRYEGFDERVRSFADEEISIGDFVMTGGEIAAMAVIEATARFLPGVLGNEGSTASESFSATLEGGLEYPHFTRPPSFRGLDVPDVLVQGNHQAIAAWRRARSAERTRSRRPDLAPKPAPAGKPHGKGEP